MLLFGAGAFLIVCAMLVFNERSHRETERKLIDRLLEKNGLAPLSEPEEETHTEIKVKKEIAKIVFPIPGIPQKKVGPLGGKR